MLMMLKKVLRITVTFNLFIHRMVLAILVETGLVQLRQKQCLKKKLHRRRVQKGHMHK